MDTTTYYSPHDQLPAPEPRTVSYPINYFYEHTAKFLIRDTVRIMNNGLHIDLNKVAELEAVLDTQLATVEQTLAKNPLIQQYLAQRHEKLIHKYIEERQTKVRPLEYFFKDFKPNDMVHRSYFMYIYATTYGLSQPSELLPTGIPKWEARLVKPFAKSNPVLRKLLDKQITSSHPIAKKAMQLLAEHKQAIHNKSFLDQIENPPIELPAFNPNSPQQKQELFEMLGIESEATTDKGNPKWDRDQIVRVNQQYSDPMIIELTQQLIDHSYASIVRSNFIEAFYRYTIDSRLYGNLKLFGAKSFRLTSSNPNLLNMPSTKSIFSAPIKQCFTAPEDYIVATADYSALEQRVLASLANEPTLIELYENELDGHCVHAIYYFKEEVEKELELTGDLTVDARAFEKAVNDGNKVLKDIRQRGKGPSFGLQYGAYPAKISATIKCSIEEAENIFNMYHNKLYPMVTKYREEYVLPVAKSNNQIHLGLGCNLITDNPDNDARTIVNATSQFWSILTLLTINKMHQLIDEAGLQEEIKITSSIYDSIYFEVKKDPAIVKWLNDNLISVMTMPFINNQKVPNLVDLEIGPDWYSLTTIINNASKNDIEDIIEKL